jgi:hypothetical protein
MHHFASQFCFASLVLFRFLLFCFDLKRSKNHLFSLPSFGALYRVFIVFYIGDLDMIMSSLTCSTVYLAAAAQHTQFGTSQADPLSRHRGRQYHGWRKKGIIHRGGGGYLRCPVFTSVHFSLHSEGSSVYCTSACVKGERAWAQILKLFTPGINFAIFSKKNHHTKIIVLSL